MTARRPVHLMAGSQAMFALSGVVSAAAALARRAEDPDADPDALAAARERLVTGTFGRCAACNAPITLARLARRPETVWCGRCAQEPGP